MSNLKNKYFKYKSKYLKIKKQIGGAKLTDLAQTNPDFRSWCRSLLEEKKSNAEKLAEFEEFKKLIDEKEHIQIYEFLERGGKTPYWIELASRPIVVSTSSVSSPAAAAIEHVSSDSSVPPTYRYMGKGFNTHATLHVKTTEGQILPLAVQSAAGSSVPIEMAYMNYEMNERVLVPAEIPLDEQCLKKAAEVSPGNILVLSLDSAPPPHAGPTAGITESVVRITSSNVRLNEQFTLEIDVPRSGKFSLQYKGYYITLQGGVIKIRF
jgi:hypothetical protein